MVSLRSPNSIHSVTEDSSSCNCTKHQVRCDYSNLDDSSDEGPVPLAQPYIPPPPPPPPPPPLDDFPSDLFLLDHLSAVFDNHMVRGTAHLTPWISALPRFLAMASSHTFVMHALLAFSANHLAWIHNSEQCRNQHHAHCSTALGGLHRTIAHFSPHNADAVLAASLLMLWQAKDWRSWSSFRKGIESVLSVMKSWQQDSAFAEFIPEDGATNTLRRRRLSNVTYRDTVLHDAAHALQRLQPALPRPSPEAHWTTQMLVYIHSLQNRTPPGTPDQQFNQLYYLRRCLFWVPPLLLRQPPPQPPPPHPTTLAVLAHLYALALDLEPLFPHLSPAFTLNLARRPLSVLLAASDPNTPHNPTGSADLLAYPRASASRYQDLRPVEAITMPDALLQLPPPGAAAAAQAAFPGTTWNAWGMPSPGFPHLGGRKTDDAGV